MRRLDQRLTTLEHEIDRQLDRSGSLAATDEMRKACCKLLGDADAIELARQWVELKLAKGATDAPEMIELTRQWDDHWRIHYGEEGEITQ